MQFSEIIICLAVVTSLSLLIQILVLFNRGKYRGKDFLSSGRSVLRRVIYVIPIALCSFTAYYEFQVVGIVLAAVLAVYALSRVWKPLFSEKHIRLHFSYEAGNYDSIRKCMVSQVIYTLIGLLYILAAFVFLNISLYALDPHSFDVAEPSTSTFIDFFYFTVVTVATLGYGDIKPLSAVARLLCSIETLVSILSFAMLFGRMVSVYSRLQEIAIDNPPEETTLDGPPQDLPADGQKQE